jgi:hypothetical protein
VVLVSIQRFSPLAAVISSHDAEIIVVPYESESMGAIESGCLAYQKRGRKREGVEEKRGCRVRLTSVMRRISRRKETGIQSKKFDKSCWISLHLFIIPNDVRVFFLLTLTWCAQVI